MKKNLVIGTLTAILSLGAAFAVPAFGDSPTEGDSGTPGQQTWQAMHEACEEGDWDAMVEAAQEVHEGLGYASCHGYGYPASEEGNAGSRGGMMGGGMMGGRWGGMM